MSPLFLILFTSSAKQNGDSKIEKGLPVKCGGRITSLLGYTTSEADGRRQTEICVGCVWLGQVRIYFPQFGYKYVPKSRAASRRLSESGGFYIIAIGN